MATEAESFDYIVTGAGSAGCAVAARLSELGRYRVLLLEAGGKDRNPWIHIPMGFSQVYANPRVNWMYESEPEAQLGGRRLYQPRGKVLGGTSSINGMVYMRGNAADYDEWRQRGCTGWDWDSVLPYFKKAEHQERGANEFHGIGGPLHVSDQPHRSELADRVVEAAIQAGLPPIEDFNDGRQEGAGYFQSTTGRQRRWSTATAYLRPARGRDNLVVRPNAHATRILIENGRAVGVTYVSGGVSRTARANGEVIVSGGVFNSPQLLQLSGVGPGALLQEMDIPVIHDLPAVGSHLQDHFYVRLAYRCTRPITMNELANSMPRKVLAMAQYMLFRAGPLAANGVTAGAFARSDPRLERPDLQFNFSPYSYASRDARGAVAHPFPGFSLSAVHLRPDSRGSVRIKSPDPLAPPAIRFNFLETQSDLQALTAGMRLARKFAQPAGTGTLCRRGTPARTGGEHRRRVRGEHPHERQFQSASRRHVPDGAGWRLGGRSAAARARHRPAACGGCIDHADRPGRQHQRAVDHDRGEGGGHDPGRCTGDGVTVLQAERWWS